MGEAAGAARVDGEDFFISYVPADEQWAEWVGWQLEEAGYGVRVPAWDAVAGSSVTGQIQQGIMRARRTIAIVSRAYLEDE
jgi:hypothetical protein